MSNLKPSKVSEIFRDCLFAKHEVPASGRPESFVEARGVMIHIGFHPQRLESHRSEVVEMLNDVHPDFREGMSFLNFCNDKNGELWTGMQPTCDELITLGVALGLVDVVMREVQSVLPGGVPYIHVHMGEKNEQLVEQDVCGS